MSWGDDREQAYSLADDLGISYDELQQTHDANGWTWNEISDRLEIQHEYAEYYENDQMPPDWLMHAYYEYQDWDDAPEWASYYHEK